MLALSRVSPPQVLAFCRAAPPQVLQQDWVALARRDVAVSSRLRTLRDKQKGDDLRVSELLTACADLARRSATRAPAHPRPASRVRAQALLLGVALIPQRSCAMRRPKITFRRPAATCRQWATSTSPRFCPALAVAPDCGRTNRTAAAAANRGAHPQRIGAGRAALGPGPCAPWTADCGLRTVDCGGSGAKAQSCIARITSRPYACIAAGCVLDVTEGWGT